MRASRLRRTLRAVTMMVAALSLTACVGLPVQGEVEVGLRVDEAPRLPEFFQVASGPVAGAGPEEIVRGFLEAAITPADSWKIARQFLTPELADTWKPSASVTVDASVASRTITASTEAEDAVESDVLVQLAQVANVDESGGYAETTGAAEIPFRLERTRDGEWRIAETPDGVVLDETTFSQVFDKYAVQYFDPSWTRLVPDIRWYPRRATIATTIAQAVVDGEPSSWLVPAVRSAFPADVALARDAVPIDGAQVADVALNRAALALDQPTLARMRTQLEASLVGAGIGVSEVSFSVDGRRLEAATVRLNEPVAEPGTLVLTADAFGTIVGDEVTPVAGVSEEILSITQPIAAIDLAVDDSHAAVRLASGQVFRVGDGRVDQLDARPGLVDPSIDPYGFIWSVPSGEPQALQASTADATPHQVAEAWPGASMITQLRVSADGARVAAVVTVGGQRWVVVSSVIRGDAGVPIELGPMKQLTRLTDSSDGLVWMGLDRVGILTGPADPTVITQTIGGTGTSAAAPSDAVALAGARSALGVRVLGAGGVVFVRSGSAWQESASGVLVLATRAGQ